MSNDIITLKDLIKGKKWKELLYSLFESRNEDIKDRYNEAIRIYGEDLKKHKEVYMQELSSIDKLYETDLLRYIAKTLCAIKHKLEG